MAQVVGAKEVVELRRPNFAKIGGGRLQKESGENWLSDEPLGASPRFLRENRTLARRG